jgi:ABC-type uncharacterized transport system permease subunit
MFSDRRLLRRYAAQMLLIWLLGLLVGAANACALEESPHDTAHVDVEVGGQDHEDQYVDEGLVNCIDFCTKTSVGFTKLTLASAVLVFAGPALLLAGRLGLFLAPQSILRPPAAGASPCMRGSPPLRIVLQRLAL